MYPTQSGELLRSALSLIPPMPCSIDVIAEEGGSFSLTLAAVEGDLIYGYGNRALVRDDLELEARLRDDRGEGWNIRFSILRTYFQSGDDLLLHLSVVAVEPHAANRRAARAHLAELATARVLYAERHARDEVFDVRLADASSTGVALVTARGMAAGDLLEIDTFLEGQPLRFEVRVVHTTPAIYGRNRVGCEITTILEADRHRLLQIAKRLHRDGSADERNPDVAARLERARTSSFATRHVRRYDTF
jgi:hypothetical protein